MSRKSGIVHGFAILYTLASLLILLEHLQFIGFRHQHELKLDWYLDYAFSLRQGNGYIACVSENPYDYPCEQTRPVYAYFLPGYPLYLAANLLIFDTGDYLPPMRMLQAVLAALISFLTVHLAGRYGILSANIAGLLMVSNLSVYEFGTVLLAETWFTFLLLIFVTLFLHTRTRRGFLVIGMLLGGLVLTRGILLLTLPLLIFVLPDRRLVWLMSGTALPLCAWIIRNLLIFGAFVPLSTGTGDVLLGANNEFVFSELNPGYWINPADLPGGDRFEAMDEVAADRAKRSAAWQFIRQQSPLVLALAGVFKVGAWAGMNEPFARKTVVMSALVIGLMVLWNTRRNPRFRIRLRRLWAKPEIRLMLLLLAGSLMNAIVFWADMRFRYPLEPYLATLAGLGVMLLRSSNGKTALPLPERQH